jgi:transcriptional regulator with XRE-family HTH domain
MYLISLKISLMDRMGNTMPARAPISTDLIAAKLGLVGQRIRAHRKALRLSATVAAEAAGMSRVTLHRIESGEASVTMGAYLNAMAALGLEFDVVAGQGRAEGARSAPQARSTGMAPHIRLADYPQLKRLAWHAPGLAELTPAEALSLYERNWRHLDRDHMDAHERQLLNDLVREQGKGYLLV